MIIRIPSQRQPLPEEEWHKIPLFPGYSVSDAGFVRNDETGYCLTRFKNQSGVAYVGLTQDRKLRNRSVALLVAEVFLPHHQFSAFDTPINLDGDRMNAHVRNLMWRPRWFAVRYHQQFIGDRRDYPRAITEMETGEEFDSSWHAAMKFGLIARDVMVATLNGMRVWPTNQQFRQTHIIPHQKRGV